MDIGFIGLGNMGYPMARRLIEAGHRLVVFDTSGQMITRLTAVGATAASSPRDVADRVETVLASLPTPDIVLAVATGPDGVAGGKKVHRFVDLSTTGSRMAIRISDALKPHNIVQIDGPVSGGVGGAEKGTLAVMVAGPRADYELLQPVLAVIGKVFFVGEKPGMGQTMKLANNMLSATAMAASSEAMVMGVKAGLDPSVMIDVINAGSGMNTATRDKFPRQRHEHCDPGQIPPRHPAGNLRLRFQQRPNVQGLAAMHGGSGSDGGADVGGQRGPPDVPAFDQRVRGG